MIFCVSFAEYIAFLTAHGYLRVAVKPTATCCIAASKVSSPSINQTAMSITVIEVDRVCDLAGLTPPDPDQFWGD